MLDKNIRFEQISKNIRSCKYCRLYKEAKNAVPGEGSINAEVIFVGEAPGQVEDETGRPFVGRAGKLLESSLTSIGYSREDVWIGNIIKHRPPGNRDPLPDEIETCQQYLKEQIKIISPKLIVTLGRFSMNYFYPEGKISRDRGSLLRLGEYNIFPVFHPAAALRNPGMMKGFLDDFKQIPQILEQIKNNFKKDIKLSDDNITDGQLKLDL